MTNLPTGRPVYANMSASVTLAAEWFDHIRQVVITGSCEHRPTLSLHLDPAVAARLAADLLAAVAAAESCVSS